jgi:8-oxo-dGTP pyrophosphatase MutT (NUDIX family)
MTRESNPWTFTDARIAFDNSWFKVEELGGTNPSGAPACYGVVRFRKLAVGVLPIDPDGMIYLVGQWRVPLGYYSWEMPEGGCEPDEAPEACARRELEEETGLLAGTLQEILRMDLSNSITDEQAFMFLATDLREGVLAPEPVEVQRQRKAHFTEVLDDVVNGRIRDSLTVAAVLRAHHMAVTGAFDRAFTDALLNKKG